MDSGSRRERSPDAPPLLMSGESTCPIIEAMLRAQIAETRDWRGEEKLRQLEMQPAKNFSSGQVLGTYRKVQAAFAFLFIHSYVSIAEFFF